MEDGDWNSWPARRFPSAIGHRPASTSVFLALAVFISGCAPAGPRALLNGKKLLDRGDYAGAVEQLKTATTLLATNAEAWNYYGVALQHAGQPADAARAYQTRAEVRPRSGGGALQSRLPLAGAEQARRGADGIHRLHAAAQQHAGRLAQARRGATASCANSLPAEKSFSTALSLDHKQRRGVERPRPGARRSAAVRRTPRNFLPPPLRRHPDYAPAHAESRDGGARIFARRRGRR